MNKTNIVPVNNANQSEWAELCAKLWPEYTAQDFIAKRKNGQYADEFLYIIDGRAIAFLSMVLRRDYVEGTDTSPVGYIEGLYVEPKFTLGAS